MSKENIVMNKKSIEIQNVKNFRGCGGYQVEPDKVTILFFFNFSHYIIYTQK